MSEDAAARLIAALGARGLTLATAESCTGGRIAAALTAVPGASRVFWGGIVAYANEVKTGVLGVDPGVIAQHGAVSEQCAVALALQARLRFGCGCALSTTGIAGPDGGSVEKPVGLVWFGFATAAGVQTEQRLFAGARHAVQQQAVDYALERMLRALEQ